VSGWISTDPIIDQYLPKYPESNENIRELAKDPLTYWKKHLPSLGGVYNSSNIGLYSYVHNNPVKFVDPNGKDVWVEGPSADETPLHQSINVGKPDGYYISISFGANGKVHIDFKNYSFGLEGEVYMDKDKGGLIVEGMYLKTTHQEDMKVLNIFFDELKSDPKVYLPETCRSFSQDLFSKIKGMGIGIDAKAPNDEKRKSYSTARAIINNVLNMFTTTTSSTSTEKKE